MTDHQQRMSMGYVRFGAMVLTSTIIMFALMYFNTLSWGHIEYSQTRAWMAVLMGAAMTIIMLGFMWHLYDNPRLNSGIVAGAIIAGAVALWLVRSQETVDDVSYMRAMIPHHSIAIMTSERATIRDPRVRNQFSRWDYSRAGQRDRRNERTHQGSAQQSASR